MEQVATVLEGETEIKKYVLRDLRAKDIFSISRILSKIGLSKFKRCLESEDVKMLVKKVQEGNKDGVGLEAVGVAMFFEIADVLLENLPNCEKELFSFLGDLSGMKAAEVEAIPPADFFDLIVETIKKPDFMDFFKRAVRSFK